MKLIYIVGDYFEASCGSQLWTTTQILEAVDRGCLPSSVTHLSFGQGVSLFKALSVRRALVSSGLLAESRIHIPSYFYHKMPHELVHKHRPENVVLSKMVRLGAECFETHLFVDAIPEIISDHLTGMHLPGMLLLEAARQGANAIFELRRSVGELGEQLCPAALAWQTEFRQFVYPIPVTLQFTVTHGERAPHSLDETIHTSFFQSGQRVGEIQSRYRLLERSRVREIEERSLKYLGMTSKECACNSQIAM